MARTKRIGADRYMKERERDTGGEREEDEGQDEGQQTRERSVSDIPKWSMKKETFKGQT